MGELRGLTWDDINFNKHTLTVNKNVVPIPDIKNNKSYTISSPKTISSYRAIPIPDFLLNELGNLYDENTKYYDFKDNWYVVGNVDPIADTTLRDRKTKNAFKHV